MTTTTTTDTVLTVTPEARDEIGRMRHHVLRIGQTFGPASKEYREAHESLVKAFADLFGWGTLRVSRDGDLSLFCSQPGGFVFGLIFHSVKRGCEVEGCRAVINDDGTRWTYMPEWRDSMCAEGECKPTYPLDFPKPGTWSFHS